MMRLCPFIDYREWNYKYVHQFYHSWYNTATYTNVCYPFYLKGAVVSPKQTFYQVSEGDGVVKCALFFLTQPLTVDPIIQS